MVDNWTAEQENEQLKKNGLNTRVISNFFAKIFHTKGSEGYNQEELSRILATHDIVINVLGWQNEPENKLSHIVSQYQASLDGKYHNDYIRALIADEINERKVNSKGSSISINQVQ